MKKTENNILVVQEVGDWERSATGQILTHIRNNPNPTQEDLRVLNQSGSRSMTRLLQSNGSIAPWNKYNSDGSINR